MSILILNMQFKMIKKYLIHITFFIKYLNQKHLFKIRITPRPNYIELQINLVIS